MKITDYISNRTPLPVRVLQFGEGNFLRAFVDWIIHRMNQQLHFNGGVSVVQPIAQGMTDILDAQEGLYTLYLNGIKNGQAVSEHEVIDCIQRTVNPYKDGQAYLSEAENPDLRFIFSNTTEAGIAFSAEDRLTDTPPASFPGKLTALLYHRYRHFAGAADKGIIIIPCELIEKNGDTLRDILLKIATHWNLEPGFSQWLKAANYFCNTLVDRIVPGYPRNRIAEIHAELGYEDTLVVEGEQFHLWVIEGPAQAQAEFPADKAGLNVLFTDDLTPYRTRKVRILNGAHTVMVPVAYLYGEEAVRQTVEHPILGKYVRETLFEEIIPTLDLPAAELAQFAEDVIDRFRNPYIHHLLLSISLNSVSKFKTRVLPSLLTYVARQGNLPRRLVFSLAALVIFYRGRTGEVIIPLNDSPEYLDFFALVWGEWETTGDTQLLAEKVLKLTLAWEKDLSEIPGLTELLGEYISSIMTKGIETAGKESEIF
ncbi:MAG: tagaturonate reductase [Bacteroidia bacterium]|nr:tagaturonate reductase [Bacteroidia bacterium]